MASYHIIVGKESYVVLLVLAVKTIARLIGIHRKAVIQQEMISLSRQSHDKIGVKSIGLHNHVQGNKYTSRICWISLNMWEYLPGPVYPVIHLNHHKPSWKEPQGWEAWNWHWRCWDSFPIHNKRLSCRIGNSARRETGIPTFWPPQLVLCTFKEVDYSWIGSVKIKTMFKPKRHRSNVRKATKGY